MAHPAKMLNGYSTFVKEFHTSNGDLEPTAMFTKCAERWRGLSETEKEYYADMSAKENLQNLWERARYLQDHPEAKLKESAAGKRKRGYADAPKYPTRWTLFVKNHANKKNKSEQSSDYKNLTDKEKKTLDAQLHSARLQYDLDLDKYKQVHPEYVPPKHSKEEREETDPEVINNSESGSSDSETETKNKKTTPPVKMPAPSSSSSSTSEKASKKEKAKEAPKPTEQPPSTKEKDVPKQSKPTPVESTKKKEKESKEAKETKEKERERKEKKHKNKH